MGNINRIDIYVGEVGSAYVDKETALKRLNAAIKNKEDMEDILADATAAKLNAENAQVGANQAYQRAEEVANELETRINELNASDPKYGLLSQLLTELRINDFDNIGLNGGNVNTANINIGELAKQIAEAEAIIKEAQGYLSEEEPVGRLIALINQYQEEYDAALEVFLGYLPEEYEDENDISDRIEGELIERINAVNAAVENANNITDAINQTSQEVDTRIQEIMNAPEPTPVQTYTISLVVENGYSETSSQSQTVNAGERAEWTVVANAGYKLPVVVENGIIIGNLVKSNPADSDFTVYVTCLEDGNQPEPQQFTVTLNIENGHTDNNQATVNEGASATFTVYPNDGFRLPDTVENASINGNTLTTVAIHSDLTINVVCVENGVEPEPGQYKYYYGSEEDIDLSKLNAVGISVNEPLTTLTQTVEPNPDTYIYFIYPKSWGKATILDSNGDGCGLGDFTEFYQYDDVKADYYIYSDEANKLFGNVYSITYQN